MHSLHTLEPLVQLGKQGMLVSDKNLVPSMQIEHDNRLFVELFANYIRVF